MDSWEKFIETSIPDKEAFYRKLNLEGITDKDTMRMLKKYGKYLK